MPIKKESLLTRCRSALRLAIDLVIDRHWGIDTLTGTWVTPEKDGKFKDAAQNVPLSYYLLFRFLRRNAFKLDDVFYDIGCGNGRVLCYVARTRVSKAIGIELSRTFADKARANAEKLRGRVSPIEVRCGDAVEMDYRDGTVFFFYNPFGPQTLRSVLNKIQETVVSNPRSICVMYQNPVYSSVFRSSGWLKYAGKREYFLCKQQMELWLYERRSRLSDESSIHAAKPCTIATAPAP